MTHRTRIARDFLRLASSGEVAAAYRDHVAPGFRHHNPWFAAGAAALAAGMEEAAVKAPNRSLTVQRTAEEGDVVFVHSRVDTQAGAVIAVVHIFRFEGDRIAELWDVGMVAPETTPNADGIF
jgi:predicted SnoaL-like aldol condensation-catalyzing enzyme